MLKKLVQYTKSILFNGGKELTEKIYFILYFYVIWLLILLAGDVQLNPGPISQENAFLLSILHCNVRSIRNKLDFIRNEFLDFNIICFTETHLNYIITNDFLDLSDSFDEPYRKDRTSHGGGILVYLNKDLVHSRITDLEAYCNESIWVKIVVNSDIYLVGTFYSPKTADKDFFRNFNLNIEAAFNISKNVIILGDLNEDLLNDNFHNLKDTLVLNSMINIIKSPTRQNALLDPILIPVDMEVSESGTIALPQGIIDHSATYLSIPFFMRSKLATKEQFGYTAELITSY